MAVLQVLFAIAYPLVIYLALGRLTPREIGFGLAALLVLRLWLLSPETLKAATRAFWVPVAAVAAVVAATVAWNHPLGLLLTPAGINLALLVTFGHSLSADRTMVERFARLQVDHLSPAELDYCRSVTRLWCGFFLANGAIALALALTGSLAAWALYTGFISYLAMGVLFTAEYLYRHWRFRRYVGAFTDPVLRRIFPPEVEAAPPERGSGPRLAPEVIGQEETANRLEQALRVPLDLDCIPGHFPGVPIVPGVVQVDWVMRAIAGWTGRRPSIRSLEALKFKKPLRPGNELVLALERDGDGAPYRFEFRQGEDVYSSGRIHLVEADGAP
ncbi:MAG: hypothetical protein ACQGVK_12835 [Myxococcota bacterium]